MGQKEAEVGKRRRWETEKLKAKEVGGRKDRRLESEKIKLWIADYGLRCKRGMTSAPNPPNEPNHLNVLNDHNDPKQLNHRKVKLSQKKESFNGFSPRPEGRNI